MSNIGDSERKTQNRVIDFFKSTLHYTYIGNLSEQENSNIIEDKLYDVAEKKLDEVFLLYEKERIFLKNTFIYDEIGEYIYNDLYSIFENKLSYAYRFEAVADGNPTTYEDYNEALKKLNGIIEKYI